MNERILNSPIPLRGRHLTESECKRLRKLGVSCSRRNRVMPDGSDHYGYIYRDTGNGWWQFGPRVEVR